MACIAVASKDRFIKEYVYIPSNSKTEKVSPCCHGSVHSSKLLTICPMLCWWLEGPVYQIKSPYTETLNFSVGVSSQAKQPTVVVISRTNRRSPLSLLRPPFP